MRLIQKIIQALPFTEASLCVLGTGFYDLIQSSHFYQEGGAIYLHVEMQKPMYGRLRAETSGGDGV